MPAVEGGGVVAAPLGGVAAAAGGVAAVAPDPEGGIAAVAVPPVVVCTFAQKFSSHSEALLLISALHLQVVVCGV